MITAKEAYRIAKVKDNKGNFIEMGIIEDMITEAVAKGYTYICTEMILQERTIKNLEVLGYKVEYWKSKQSYDDSCGYSISWDETE